MKDLNMKGDRKVKKKRSFFGAAVDVWRYRIITILIFAVPVLLLDYLTELLADSSGAAITTANMGQFFSWRLPLFIVLSIALVLVFIIFEILGQVHLSYDLLTGREVSVFREIGRGFKSVKHFLSPKGLLVALFIAVAVPLCGIGFSISLTESFRIPNFITSVIFSKPLFTILYAAGIVALIIVAFRWIFTVHGMLLDDKKAGEAMKQSVTLIKKNFKDFLIRFLIIIIYSAAIMGASYFVCKVLPGIVLKNAGQSLPAGYIIDVIKNGVSDVDAPVLGYRIAGALCILLGKYINAFVTLLVASNIMIKLTDRYLVYTGKHLEKCTEVPQKSYVLRKLAFFLVPAGIAAGACLIGIFFNQIPLFRNDSMPQIIAHRTGGTMASENSLEGVDESVKRGVYGAETDIQRTKDGAYVINHDSTFNRLTGVDKAAEDMTLSEVKELRIKDTTGSGALLEVPTMEELLDRCKGRITAFVELKGACVDEKMADDAVAAIRERNMTDEAVLISLKYDVLDYVKKTYPEIKTGVLIFGGMGDISKLNCDMILMEEEMATFWQIMQLEAAEKQTGIWTVNKESGMKHFLNSGADFIITDEIPMGVEMQEKLKERTDTELMEDRIEFIL